jgi:hypothetical protein
MAMAAEHKVWRFAAPGEAYLHRSARTREASDLAREIPEFGELWRGPHTSTHVGPHARSHANGILPSRRV